MSSTQLPDGDSLSRMFEEASKCLSAENQTVLSSLINYVIFNREFLRDPPPCSGFSLAMFLAANRHLPTLDSESSKRIAFLLDTFARERQPHASPSGVDVDRVRDTFAQLSDMLSKSPTLYGPVVQQVNDILDFAQRAVDRTNQLAEETIRLEGVMQQLRDVNVQLARDNESLREKLVAAQNDATAAGLL